MTRVTPLLLLAAVAALADGPADNVPDKVRPIPPVGLKLSPREEADLKNGLEALGRSLHGLELQLKGQPRWARLIPDAEVFFKAVHHAKENNEFHNPAELQLALQLLKEGESRVQEIRDGKPDYLKGRHGRVVRGYRSRIDGSVQPYGLVVPETTRPGGKHRLDVWLHGRGEKLSEVAFLGQRMSLKTRDAFTPPGAIVLHPYGRYCNAFKFAGEIDVLEAIEHLKQDYPIDDDRVVMRGFSMGGAGCWQFAVHYPDRWVAAAPGAGFSETPRFLDVFQKEKLAPTEYEKKLWRLYDCDGYAANLANLPTVAYSGEKDNQKQAADVMADALKKENIDLVHIIGPGTGHSYHPRSRAEIDERIDKLAALGRPRVPEFLRFTTFTLRYDRSYWVRLDALAKHWEKASFNAWFNTGRQEITTKNVRAFTLTFGPGETPLRFARQPHVHIDNMQVVGPPVRSDRSWTASYVKVDGMWKLGSVPADQLRKRHGLQGPIDDAFMDSFLMVSPSGKGWHDKTASWAQGEMRHMINHWRKQFRGTVRLKDDKNVTAEDIAQHNLVLWGDPASNSVLAKILPKLPISWDAKTLTVGQQSFASEHHAPVLIYPNPLNPKRYVVLNSGFTFREYDQLNNARQVPKLPDYAVIDVRTPPSSRRPGKVALADFFDEQWQLPKE